MRGLDDLQTYRFSSTVDPDKYPQLVKNTCRAADQLPTAAVGAAVVSQCTASALGTYHMRHVQRRSATTRHLQDGLRVQVAPAEWNSIQLVDRRNTVPRIRVLPRIRKYFSHFVSSPCLFVSEMQRKASTAAESNNCQTQTTTALLPASSSLRPTPRDFLFKYT